MLRNDGSVSMTAAGTLQRAQVQQYRRQAACDWLDDVRPCLALYLVLAVSSSKHVPTWLQDYMIAHSVLEDVETWEPSDVVRERILHMCRASLTVIYRHGAIVWRLLCTRMIKVEPSTGAVIVVSPSVLWERIDMMSRLRDELDDRIELRIGGESDEQ